MRPSLKFTKIIKSEAGRNIWFLALGIIILVIQGIVLTSYAEKYIDLSLWDETLYLGNGINFFAKYPQANWGPFYSLWYFIINLFASDPVNLYYFNYRLMAILPSIFILILLSRLTKNIIFSFFFSYMFLISMINLPVLPKVSHFALLIILSGLIFIYNSRDEGRKYLIALYSSIFVTYIRPEFIICIPVLLIITIVMVLKNRLKAINLLPFILLLILLFSIAGNPYSSDRSLTAFGQAYEKNIPLSERIENGKVKDWQKIMDDNFGKPVSLTNVIVNNPGKFLNHVWGNVIRMPGFLFGNLDLIIPSWVNQYAALFILFCFICGSVYLWSTLQSIKTDNKLISIFFISVIFSVAPLISIILYFPRSHYLLLLLPFLYIFISPLGIRLKITAKLAETTAFTTIVILSFILLPGIKEYSNKSLLINRLTVEDIRRISITKSVNILENEGGLNSYLGNNYKWIHIDDKKEPFENFIKNKQINMIILSNNLNQSDKLNSDPSWFQFLDNPGGFNFRKVNSRAEISIYLKEGF